MRVFINGNLIPDSTPDPVTGCANAYDKELCQSFVDVYQFQAIENAHSAKLAAHDPMIQAVHDHIVFGGHIAKGLWVINETIYKALPYDQVGAAVHGFLKFIQM